MLKRLQQLVLVCLVIITPAALAAEPSAEPLAFDDNPLTDEITLPDWFKLSFLDLNDSLKEAEKSGKRGVIIYFHLHDCAYCKAQIDVNWGSPDIAAYTRKYFDVIAIDLRGLRTVTDFDGKTTTEKAYAAHVKTDFTPTQFFYNTQGQLVLRLPGFRPPYQYRAALEFVADGHYRHTRLAEYLARAEAALSFGQEELNEHDAFQPPPFNLDRRSKRATQPLLVIFEHPRCHACDLLHAGPLSNDEVNQQLNKLDVVQLNSRADVPVITPDGQKTTSRAWAEQLQLSFAPTLIFFDEQGQEIIRVESVIRLYRLNKILAYVLSKGYKTYPTLQLWQQSQRQ